MSPEDIRKLLGGYATGTLTTEEQQALFAAALDDQELFDELAREQSLRDLLRDPAARAELLGALDTPASRPGGFWQWLGRPLVAGLATAGVAAIAIVAVWQGTRGPTVKPQPMIVAELKRLEPSPAPPVAQFPPPASTRDQGAAAPAMALPSRRFDAGTTSQVAGSATDVMKEKKTVNAMAPSPTRQTDAGTESQTAGSTTDLRKEEKAVKAMAPSPTLMADAVTQSKIVKDRAAPVLDTKKLGTKTVAEMAAPPPPPPPPAAMPTFMARKAEADAASPAAMAGVSAGAVQANIPLDARALFYVGQSAPGANTLVQPSRGGSAAAPPAAPAAPQKDDPAKMAKATSGLIAPITATAQRLGVRVSILRGPGEADLTTVLDPGETVRLKLIPNADGFLYVTEGARMLAGGRAQRWQPFETPELRFEGSGGKQLYVMLSLRPRTVAPLSLESLARQNLVESSAGQERATYIVSGPREAGAQEVVVPVTLTYR